MTQGTKTSELQRTVTHTHFKSKLAAIDQVAIDHTVTNCNTLQHTVVHYNTHTHYNSALAPIDKIQYCLRLKTPHFDRLVRALLTKPRISMTTHIRLENAFYIVSKNTIKSGIRFILDWLYRFWSKRCDFLSVEQFIYSRFLAIKRPRTRSTAARQVRYAHERDLVTNQNV